MYWEVDDDVDNCEFNLKMDERMDESTVHENT